MKHTAPDTSSDKKGHICPPSNAKHPSDRWESLFVYGFICRFTQLRAKVEGFHSPMDFEDALLSPEPNLIMTQILARFVLNLRPGTRNLSSDVISSTVASVLQEYFKTPERTVFWDDALRANVDPFQNMPNGFFAADWDLKLKILRQLVELQLCHSHEIKAIIDRAWGVIHNKHKKTEMPSLPPPPGDPHSQERLQLVPLGQDKERKRYWVVDDSPRVYMSTNPWKITATFQTIASTRDEYMAILEKVKEAAPSEPKAGEKRSKLETAHLALLKALQDRVEVIDNELARIQRVQKKIQQRNLLIASAELRETRTRRRATRPDYSYMNNPESDNDADEYAYQPHEEEDDEYEDQTEFDDFGDPVSRPGAASTRRSTRANGNRGKDEWSDWRGERRSRRLGAPADTQLDGPPTKRARTEDSVVSGHSSDAPQANGTGNNAKIKINGAAAIKPTETAVEAIAGKKKSKFWYYAVEPVPGAPVPAPSDLPQTSDSAPQSEGSRADLEPMSDEPNGNGKRYPSTTPSVSGSTAEELYEKSIGGSLSPASSMDES
ncbi:hypothetical protein L226DRAFT_528548 [Lentinus tigrinus ALCF2SS1-7]|uniref:WHIM1 domain-containing protein n=1 Tax=Lentinus tigrinus ALCF2SS1-6 TaxID=1328759 RepID=A0A5C2RXV6_9APHY|nr:hypothetical protein L227DRAFT_579383 [Lentinus tigrinus ALCF2SS1-6]RPD82381.1 hypothetical protein L226DRAFT_528548 [Lentinus tigrinus ALCF2SS1-7]